MFSDRNNFNCLILILLVVFVHLLTLNFYPTNFEGGFGLGANFFQSENKLDLYKIYSKSQFNTIAFSLFASALRIIIPFINGDQAIRILSSSSYIFLGFALINLNKFYKVNYSNFLVILLALSNTIIWTYGHRMYADLFSFSISILGISIILNNTKYINRSIFLISIGIILKPFNLFFLIVFLFIIHFKYKNFSLLRKLFYLIYLLAIPFFYYLIIFLLFGDIFKPKNSEDLSVALFSTDKARNFYYFFNNFISYIGYFFLIFLPFSLLFTFKFFKILNLWKFLVLLFLILFFTYFLSIIMTKSAELDFGPLQVFIGNNLLIIFISLFFMVFCFSFILLALNNEFNHEIKKNIFITLAFILIYFACLSLIKGSQRYIIMAIPFFYFIVLSIQYNKAIISITVILYFLCNLYLLTHYYFTGKSSNEILIYLKNNDILFSTIPGPITPHVYHHYQRIENYNTGESMYLKNVKYKVVEGSIENSIFKTNNFIKNYSIVFNSD